MLKLGKETAIYVASERVDFRKAINGLAALVLEHFEKAPQDGSVYVFYNGDYTRVKCLFWDKNGFVLYQKRLERGRFKLKGRRESALSINQDQLSWLLAGLDFSLMNEFSHLGYSEYF